MTGVDASALRRQFVVPDEVVNLLPWADPDNENDRHALLEQEHPELAEALNRDPPELVLHGRTVNAALHLAMHQIVGNQLWHDDPQQMWQTAQRLTGLGYSRHDTLHMLMTVVGEDVRAVLNGEPGSDPDQIQQASDALPGSWHALEERDGQDDSIAETPPLNRQQRRAAKRRRP